MPFYLLPISHVASESRRRAVWAIETLRPEIVAVELDAPRLAGLLSRRLDGRFDIRRPKESVIAMALQGIQRFFGGKTGQVPGEEFLLAVRAASSAGAQVALIDQDISVTMKRLSASLGLRSVLRLIRLTFSGKKMEAFDLDKVPEERLVRRMLAELKKEFPKVYSAIVTERDAVMAGRLRSIPPERSVLVVVGAAHVPGLKRRLAGSQVI